MKTCIFCLSILLLMLGCNLPRLSENEQNLRRYRYRSEQRDREAFLYKYQRMQFEAYQGEIASDTLHTYRYFQFDSVRVYLYVKKAQGYEAFFQSGLLHPQMIYCELMDTCEPVPEYDMYYAKTGEKVKLDIWGWEGHTIMIDQFEELTRLNLKHRRRFKFWVHPHKTRINGGNHIFLMEVTNRGASMYAPIEEFVKGGHISFLLADRIMM